MAMNSSNQKEEPDDDKKAECNRLEDGVIS